MHSWIDRFSVWYAVGFLGQILFGSRFIVQWIASESVRRSVVPPIFWYLSIGGGLALFLYAWHRQDLVFVIGQGAGLFVYVRNLMLGRERSLA